MIIRKSQGEVFQNEAENNFRRALRLSLAEKYPDTLPRFPEDIQDTMVANMLGRARRRGITWQSALVTFAELMLAIAPNFDEEHHIRTALGLKWLGPDRVMQSITERVPAEAWELAEAASEDLPLFTRPELLRSALLARSTEAIPLVLWDFAEQIDPGRLAGESNAIAEALNLMDVQDATLTIAVWKTLYGPDFRNSATNLWIDDVFGRTRTSREKVAMLKFRIALDHGRFV